MKYFIDTNIIIDFLNNKEEAIRLITDIANSDSLLYTNRLVYLESLRTIHMNSTNVFNRAVETLNTIEKVDITTEIYNNAINFSRFFKTVKHQSLKGKCEAIDILHFMTAKYYNLELITYDGDFEKLETIYQEFLEAQVV